MDEPMRPGFKPWAGAAADEWDNAGDPVLITDMTRCEPKSAQSPVLKMGMWKAMPYETVKGVTGSMLWASEEARAPEMNVSLGVEGWYAIFVGIYSSAEFPSKLWLRLSGEDVPVSRINDWANAKGRHFENNESRYNCGHGSSEEVFFKAARLKKDDALFFAQQRAGIYVKAAGVTHVKLIPLSADEADFIEKDAADPSHRTMAATEDGYSYAYMCKYETREECETAIEGTRDSDVGTLLLHTPGADKTNYPSKVGHLEGLHKDLFLSGGCRCFVESVKAMAAQGLIPLKVLIDHGHAMGRKVHVGIRPAGWSFYEPYCDSVESPFFMNNPQWRCADRDGTEVTRMSWAVPEVRAHLIGLLAEEVSFGADGVQLVFNRGYPFSLYEPAAVEVFRGMFGEYPDGIDETSERYLDWRYAIFKTFMLELREMLAAEQRRRGAPAGAKPLEISVTVLGNEWDNKYYGADVRRMVADGLVDELFVWPWEFANTNKGFELEFFRDVCAPAGIPFTPVIMTVNTATDWNSLAAVRKFYEAGARGVALWDIPIFECDIFHWAILSRLGHVEETLWREKNMDVTKPPRKYVEFRKLGEHVRTGRFGVQWGG